MTPGRRCGGSSPAPPTMPWCSLSPSSTESGDGTNDLYATISLRQYRAPQAPVVTGAGESGGTSTRQAATGAAQSRTYTVVKGDTLWGIAKKFYGDGSKYTRIAGANSAVVKNPNLIYPGQVLTIQPWRICRPIGRGRSVATANAIRSTYDPLRGRGSWSCDGVQLGHRGRGGRQWSMNCC